MNQHLTRASIVVLAWIVLCAPMTSRAQAPDDAVAGLTADTTVPMPGFYAAPDVSVSGSDHLLDLSSDLSCDSLESWLQAGDWRIDLDRLVKPPKTKGKQAFTLTPNRWVALSDGDEIAIARLGPFGDGCTGTVTRLSRQAISLTGTRSFDGEANAYPLRCMPGDGKVELMLAYLLDGGGTVSLGVTVPLSPGTHPGEKVSAVLSQVTLSSKDLVDILSSVLSGKQPRGLDRGVEQLAPGPNTEVTITALEPLMGTISVPGASAKARHQSVEAGFRCDLPWTMARSAEPVSEASPAPDASSPPVP